MTKFYHFIRFFNSKFETHFNLTKEEVYSVLSQIRIIDPNTQVAFVTNCEIEQDDLVITFKDETVIPP